MEIKNWLISRKYQIMLIIILLALAFIMGCTTGNSNAPVPTGPIGGGCG